MQPEDQLLIEKESTETSFPLYAFLAFQSSNSQTKSCLGAHNEILNTFIRIVRTKSLMHKVVQ